MLLRFIAKKMKEAQYNVLEDGTYFGEIPGLKGIWANGKHLENCRNQLQEVLEDWILLKIKFGEKIPGFTFRIDRRNLVKHAS